MLLVLRGLKLLHLVMLFVLPGLPVIPCEDRRLDPKHEKALVQTPPQGMTGGILEKQG